jgi:hypothetical protein
MAIAVANGAVEERVEIIAEAVGLFLLVGRVLCRRFQPNVLAAVREHVVNDSLGCLSTFIGTPRS